MTERCCHRSSMHWIWVNFSARILPIPKQTFEKWKFKVEFPFCESVTFVQRVFCSFEQKKITTLNVVNVSEHNIRNVQVHSRQVAARKWKATNQNSFQDIFVSLFTSDQPKNTNWTNKKRIKTISKRKKRFFVYAQMGISSAKWKSQSQNILCEWKWWSEKKKKNGFRFRGVKSKWIYDGIVFCPPRDTFTSWISHQRKLLFSARRRDAGISKSDASRLHMVLQ